MATKTKRNSRKTVKRPAIRKLSSQLFFGICRYWKLERNQLIAINGRFYRVRGPFHARHILDWKIKFVWPWIKVSTYYSGASLETYTNTKS